MIGPISLVYLTSARLPSHVVCIFVFFCFLILCVFFIWLKYPTVRVDCLAFNFFILHNIFPLYISFPTSPLLCSLDSFFCGFCHSISATAAACLQLSPGVFR